ncbi:hypothetical protein RRG08_000444 [Elysia crispata]|uniref:Uncharacterized protein n=1 Tax=Elysia crispata TaxID=231223 RepID=A0AAE1CW04_9GAST|nr:hypothetical protein RRG08_000444 [Elysia crispata]
MKTSAVIVLAVFCTAAVVEARSVDKRDFWDDLSKILDKGFDQLDDLSAAIIKNGTDIVDAVVDTTLKLARSARLSLGHVIDDIGDTELDDIVNVVRQLLVQTRDALNLDDMIKQIRKALGPEVDNISDDDLKKVVGTVKNGINKDR